MLHDVKGLADPHLPLHSSRATSNARAAARSGVLPSESASAAHEGALATEWSLGIEAALQMLGQGFIDHPANSALRAALRDQSLSPERYWSELFGLVCRCVLLFSAEARGCLHPESSSREARLSCARQYASWLGLRAVFRGLSHGEPRLALPALGGIFSEQRCAWLDAAQLDDGVLSSALGLLGWQRVGSEGPRELPPGELEVRWAELTPEQLGSAYESLLGLRPALEDDAGQLRWRTRDEQPGGLRRRTGSYYTPDRLVQTLLDTALEPVVQDTLAAHSEQPARALSRLAVVDPACGAGYFLLAAARRLARHVTRSAAPGDVLSEYPSALRQVLLQCCFGVDLNPLAVEICRLGFWLEAADVSLPLSAFDAHVVQGHSLFGATPEWLARGVPDAAWKALPGDDKRVARTLELRNQRAAAEPVSASARAGIALEPAREKLLADAWCAAFVWPKQPSAHADAAPTNEIWLRAWRSGAELPPGTARALEEIAEQHRFFHWHLEFADVFARGGFDLVLGNPPWIAHAGRAAQRLPPALKRFYACNYPSFADYPTTHGMFVHLAARVLRDGGYLGLVVPSSLSELGGYAPTRMAHDQLCDFPGELLDFGEGQFAGVTQPCMALVSRRSASGRQLGGVGQPWPVQRRDLDPGARALIARLTRLPALPPGLFGERGVQSDRELLRHFLLSSAATGRFCTAIREGTDVREFELCAARWHVDRAALGTRLRTADEFRRVTVLVRQTARYPIAALSDGMAFRNSLLAVFATAEWPATLLVALLNSALIRWLHYMRFRDARQPILPQLKIGHLRSIPAPPLAAGAAVARLTELGRRSSAELALGGGVRRQLDELVFESYELSAAERELVSRWHAENAPRPRPRAGTRADV
jgi:hypothetical protein